MSKTIELKTNLHCGGCVRRLSGYMEDLPQVEAWTVDLESPEKRLRVQASDELQVQDLLDVLDEAGFEGEVLKA